MAHAEVKLPRAEGGEALARLVRVAGRETTLVAVAVATVGLHVAADNFTQPRPGPSAAANLASGPVPLAPRPAAVTEAGRVRASPRAASRLLLAVFGVL